MPRAWWKTASFDDPAELFRGVVAVVAPHMDDEMLGCGGILARLPDKRRIHVIYATDGSQALPPGLTRYDAIAPGFPIIRMREAQLAAQVLGIPEENAHFLDLPDGRQLNSHIEELSRRFRDVIAMIRPDCVLTPFRYDRHFDHIAVNRVTAAVLRDKRFNCAIFEYFVYYRWRLLPAGDIRAYIRPEHLVGVATACEAGRKRAALDCYQSQTTKVYPWQESPILSQALLNEVCHNPEFFLRYDSVVAGTDIFTKAQTWIRLVHWLEPLLKQRKDQIHAVWHRVTG